MYYLIIRHNRFSGCSGQEEQMGSLVPIFLLLALAAALCILISKYRSLLHAFREQQKEKEEQRLVLNANQDEIKSRLLLDLCCGADGGKEDIAKSIAFFGLEERLQCVSVVIIQVPVSLRLFYNFHKSEFKAAQKEQLCACRAASEPYFPSEWLWENPGTMVGILDLSGVPAGDMRLMGINKLGDELENVCAQESDGPPMIAFGSATASIKELHLSYSQAAELLNHKIHNHLTTPYSYEEFKRSQVQFDYNKQQQLSRYIRLGKSREAEDFLKSYFSVIHANPDTSVSFVKKTAEQIINVMIGTTKDMPVVSGDCAPLYEQALDHLEKLSKVHDYGQLLLPLAQDVCGFVLEAGANKGKRKIDQLSKWMNDNYNSDLSLEAMAAYIGCSPAYTSRLFKKETGYDIITYLSGIRVEHAKELLCTTQITVAEIAVLVGFNNQQTFIRNFKKQTGLTPTEYRSLPADLHGDGCTRPDAPSSGP